MQSKKETVFVGLSGGVDSSVSAKRLLDSGYTVVGVFIKTWHPDFLHCNEEAERLDAMRVAAKLQIPFLTCDAEESYKNQVADYMIREYKEGRTPNPDVMCNKFVKFGTFLSFAQSCGADKVATGHYAQVGKMHDRYRLYRGADSNKDQSYFLWTLTQEQLSNIYFPVGDTLKPKIREEAKRADLPTFAKTDSQGICFLGQVDIKEFLSHYIQVEPGNVLDTDGRIIGTHDGALFYTLGQRQGFYVQTHTDTSEPMYILEKNIYENTLIVGTKQREVGKTQVLTLTHCNFINPVPIRCSAQFRYRQKPFRVETHPVHPDTISISVCDEHVELPSLGQSCVLYDGEECLGGGIIQSIHEQL